MPSQLKQVQFVSRHTVRSPLPGEMEQIKEFVTQPWPEWDVPLGHVSEHGRWLAKNLGSWWRKHYGPRMEIQPGHPDPSRWVFVHANSVPRCVDTANAWLDGGMGTTDHEVAVHHEPIKEKTEYDPLYMPVYTGKVKVSGVRHAVLGRMGGDPQNAIESIMRSLELIQRVFGTAICSPELYGHENEVLETGDCTGTLRVAQVASDMFIMQRANGWTMSKVAWGRLDPHELLDVARARVFVDGLLMEAPQYCEYQASNLMARVLAGMDQLVNGRDVDALPHDGDKRLIGYFGHDTNIEALAGLLGVSWIPRGWVQNQSPPAGQLVFELHQADDGEWFVRLYFVTLTLEQMAYGVTVSPERPPSRCPLSMKHKSRADSFDIPYLEFRHEVVERLEPDAITDPRLALWVKMLDRAPRIKETVREGLDRLRRDSEDEG